MKTWELLVANSTIETGTAWEHLNAQKSGGEDSVVFVSGVSGNVSAINLTAILTSNPLTSSIESTMLDTEITDTAMEASITTQSLTGSITADTISGVI